MIEDFRTDRLILEELSTELARLHRRLDGYEERYNHWAVATVFGRLVGQLGRPHGA